MKGKYRFELPHYQFILFLYMLIHKQVFLYVPFKLLQKNFQTMLRNYVFPGLFLIFFSIAYF